MWVESVPGVGAQRCIDAGGLDAGALPSWLPLPLHMMTQRRMYHPRSVLDLYSAVPQFTLHKTDRPKTTLRGGTVQVWQAIEGAMGGLSACVLTGQQWLVERHHACPRVCLYEGQGQCMRHLTQLGVGMVKCIYRRQLKGPDRQKQ